MAYGPGSDPFGIAAVGIELQAVNSNPAGQEAQCEDENGSVLASTVFGQMTPVTARYKVKAGDTVTPPKLGAAISTHYMTRFAPKRSNRDVLEIEVEGYPASLFAAAPPTFTIDGLFPTNYLLGGKGAIAAGITVSTGKVISSSIVCSVNVGTPLLDEAGTIVDIPISGGRMEATNETQVSTGTPAATAAEDWALKPDSGAASNDNQSYGTKTFGAFRNIVADV